MAGAFLMRHRGVLCAVPSGQVLSVEGAAHDVERLELWSTPRDAGTLRCVRVRTSHGERGLDCTVAKLVELRPSEVFGLPAAVDRELRRPHVVGLARVDGDWVWLVDLERK